MNRLAKSLLVGLLEQENYITAFYGGGFKPPTKGHFAVVKKSLEQFPDIDKFYIIIGSGIRDGISQDESYSVWNIYKKYLGDKVEIVKADSSPLKYVKDYIKENTDHKSLVFIGSRDGNDEDAQDFVKRKEFFDKYGDHVEVKNIVTTGGVSGTKAREAAKVSKEQFFQYLPKELTDEERELIFEYVQTVIQEIKIPNASDIKKKFKIFLEKLKQEGKETKDAYNLLVQAAKGEIKLTDLNKQQIKEQLKDILKSVFGAAIFALPAGGLVLLLLKLIKLHRLVTPSAFLEENDPEDGKAVPYGSGYNKLNENESFYLDIPKFNQPKTTQQYLIENINEINLSKENAVDINGDLTGGAFTVGDITYEYSIKNIPNPYKDLGLFYNIQFTPRGEVTSIPKGGKENYIKILSTMYKIIVDFIEKEQPDYIGISSLDNSGDKNYHTVYNRLTTNNLNLIPGYFRKDSSLQFDSPQGKGRFIVLKRKESLNENATYSSNIDYKQKIVDLTNYMRKKGYKIDPLPKVIFNNGDKENAKNFFGKTAYYDPNTMIIYLYTEGRHPKDIVRSFSHEMIHHIQNLEDRLGNITTQNTSEDDHLDKIEREAYLNGNITFRNWADSLNKNISPFSKDIKESILSDIKEYGDILEFKIDLTDTYQYSFNSKVGEFYDDINNVKVIVKLKPTIKNISEFKFYSLQNGKQLSFSRLKHHNPKVMNTIFKIFMDEVLPNNPKILIQPFDYLRYRLFRAMLNNNLDGNQYKIDTKDDPMGQSILLVQKLNEAKKPYKHKHGFDDKLGKDPFGLNQYARELAQSLEEVLFIAGKEVEKIENPTNNPEDAIVIYKDGTSEPYLDTIKEGRKKKKDPKKGTGKKPKGSGRRLYTDEDPKDTVGVSFRTKEDIVDTLNKKSFKAKSHARQSQIINLIHQRVRAAYQNTKDPDTKSRLKRGLDYIEKRKEASKEKTKRLKNITENIQNPDVKFKRPKLKYSYTSLQPYIDKETMEEHFDKHFKGYTDKLNTELDEKKIRVEAEDQIQAIQKILGKYSKNNIIKNNGGGFYNHVLYFENITPDYKSPSSKFRKMLEENFNSFSEFKDKFKEAGLKQFGSGWVFLIKKGNKLVIESYANQDNPYLDKDFKGEILIAMDVWEHAYYLKHKSQRGKYIDDFFRVIDYKVAEERLKEEKTLSENGQKIAKKNMNDYKKSNNPSGKVKDPFGLNQYARELAQGLEEAIVGDKIECDNCGWSWDIEDGGDDLYTCHKCWHDNTPKQLNEGRYDTLANKLSSTAFRVFKDTHDRGDKEGSFKFRIDHPEEEHDIPSKDFFFDFEGTVEITDSEYKVDGGANAGFDERWR
jgi:Fe-Mn family superoxide dismutase